MRSYYLVSVFYYFPAHAAQVIDMVCCECFCDFNFVSHFVLLVLWFVSVYTYNIPQKKTKVNNYFIYFAFSFSYPARRGILTVAL